MTMETSRKRPLEEDPAFTARKRSQQAANDRGTPVNGMDVESEPREDDNLELFRKEAIYRRMRHYAKECQRAHNTIDQIDSQRAKHAAGLAAMEAAWVLLIERLRLLVKPQDLPRQEQSPSFFDLVSSSSIEPALTDALRDRTRATEELFQSLAHVGQSVSLPDSDDLRRECEKLQTENVAMHAQVSILRTRLSESEDALTKNREDLAASENRLERARTRTRRRSRESSNAVESDELQKRRNEELASKSEAQIMAAAGNTLNGKLPSPIANDLEDLKAIIENKEEQINRLSQEVSRLTKDNQVLRVQLTDPDTEFVATSTAYQTLLEQAATHCANAEEFRERYQQLQIEIGDLRMSRKEFQEECIVDYQAKIEEYKIQLAKRDNDINRIRESRDSVQAELHDKKTSMQAQVEGYRHTKSLLSARLERVKTLQNEVARLRARMAAYTGNDDLYRFLLKNEEQDQSFVDHLVKSNSELQARFDALETILGQAKNRAELQENAETRLALIEARRKLSMYEGLYGRDEPTNENLLKELATKSDELKKCQLVSEAKENEIVSQQAALDQLASSWETLNDKIDTKLTEISSMEEKLSKIAGEKAKADNKYFSALRSKETAENERKYLSRTYEKQTKVMEKLAESEKSLQAQLAQQQREMEHQERTIAVHRDKFLALENELKQTQLRKDSAERRLTETSKILTKLETEGRDRSQAVRRLEDELSRVKRDLDRAQTKAKLTTPASGSQRERELEEDVRRCMAILKCSTCELNLRTHILTKCLHTFCKECIEARVSTRQRKCPACNLAFSQGEMQQMYFQ